MTTLLFVRHGQASFGQENYDQLSKLGIKQAKLLGINFAHAERKINTIITGSLKRQKDTAQHFSASYQANQPDSSISLPTPHVITQLDEFNHLDVFIKSHPDFTTREGMEAHVQSIATDTNSDPKLVLASLFNTAMQRWHSGEFDKDYIESWAQFNQRVQQAFQQVIDYANMTHHRTASEMTSSDPTLMIVTSGGVIAALSASLLRQGSQQAYQINRSLLNTGITTVTLKNDQATLLSLNEHGHLFYQGNSYLTWY